jgi:serine/threonine protein kinase
MLTGNHTEQQPYAAFVISGGLKIRFIFTRDDKDRNILEKLGDGTFGSVYRGRTETGLQEDVAIKLLYDNNAIRPRQISELNKQELDALIDPLAKHYEKDPNELKKAILQHRDSGYSLWKELEKSYHAASNTADPVSEELDFESFIKAVAAQVSSSAVYRFRQEQSVTGTLIDSSRLRFGVDDTRGIVRVLGGADDFLSVLAASSDLKKYFDEIDPITVSNYVLVMDLYSFSLKDLLERPVIEKDNTGYDILKTLPHKERIREALIILKGAADGLEKLHNVHTSETHFMSLFHRDIKPGNVFIKRTSIDAFEVALGDLGNLPYVPGPSPSAKIDSSLERPPDYEYAPGTQNFRSPEQKYYMDVADVEVVILPELNIEDRVRQILMGANRGRVSSYGSASDQDHAAAGTGGPVNNEDDNGSSRLEVFDDRQLSSDVSSDYSSSGSNNCAVLIVRDPKFRNTLIEKNDFVIFSKDTERKHLPITRCIPLSEDKRKNVSGYWGFVLDVDLEEANIRTDKKTQVEFYKTQGYRTDLFGIGALMFDMITVGASPEQFYESIRRYEGQSIDTIVNRYDTLTRGELEGENPEFIEIFRPLRNHNNPFNPYPGKEIVEFILKCMLYQSEGTFYQENADEPWKASEALRSRMEELRVEYTRGYQNLAERVSILIHRPLTSQLEIKDVGQSIPFNQRIDELQGLAEWPHHEQLDTPLTVANRLMYGTYYFWRVVDLVRDAIPAGKQFGKQETEQTQSTDSPLLLQILPTFISLQLPEEDRNKRAELTLTALYIDLLKELQEDRLELLIRSASNPFVPNEIAGMRRDIKLLRSQDPGASGQERIKCRYRFRDTAIVSRNPSEHDLIVVGSQLYRIDKKSNGNELEIEFLGKGSPTEAALWDGKNYADAIYFSRIDPLKYYLEMLGLYLQQLVLTYSPITTTTRDRVDIHALLRAFEIGPPFHILTLKSQSDNELLGIHERCVRMLIRLNMHEAEDSYFDRMQQCSMKFITMRRNSTGASWRCWISPILLSQTTQNQLAHLRAYPLTSQIWLMT